MAKLTQIKFKFSASVLPDLNIEMVKLDGDLETSEEVSSSKLLEDYFSESYEFDRRRLIIELFRIWFRYKFENVASIGTQWLSPEKCAMVAIRLRLDKVFRSSAVWREPIHVPSMYPTYFESSRFTTNILVDDLVEFIISNPSPVPKLLLILRAHKARYSDHTKENCVICELCVKDLEITHKSLAKLLKTAISKHEPRLLEKRRRKLIL